VRRVLSESRRPENRSRLTFTHAVVVTSVAARRRTDSFDHHSFKTVVTVAPVVFSVARPNTEKVSPMLQSFVPHPLQDQAEIDKDVVPTNHDLPLCLMCEQGAQ